MKLEKYTFKALIDYLIEHGYPPESLAVEYPIGKYRVDLAVIDPESKLPIALFEIKQKRTPSTEAFGRKQLKSFLSYLGTKSIPTYLVFVKDGTPPFEIKRVTLEERQVPDDEKVYPSETELNFNIIQNSSRSALLAETKRKRKRTVDFLTAQCIVIVAILITLLCLDAIGEISISPVHLTIGGTIIAISLIPYASKLRFLGFEFERRTPKNHHKD